MVHRLLICSFILSILTTPSAAADQQASDTQIIHLLNRLSFAPTEEDLIWVRAHGTEAYIEQQLNPATIPISPDLTNELLRRTTLTASLPILAERYQMPMEEKLTPDDRKTLNNERKIIVRELTEAKILRAIESQAQLQELMTDFWFNHFNVFAEKGFDKIAISSYERDAIRPFVFGRFRDLLGATAHHPAMLFYLDNWQNTDPNSRFAKRAADRGGKQVGINENYARELMELHTLGVNAGYTQADVTTLATILTGWGLKRGPRWSDRASFSFDRNRHDDRDKVLFGSVIKGGEEDEVEGVLDNLAKAPATAHHIAYELAQYFVSDNPPEQLIELLSKTYLDTDGNIKLVLETLFHSEEFWDPKVYHSKFKPPFRYVVSLYRAAHVPATDDEKRIEGALAQMGEPLYHCLVPTGYAITNDQWLNSDALLKRIMLSRMIAHRISEASMRSLVASFGDTLSPATMRAVTTSPEGMKAALLLSSSEFLYY